MKKSILHVLLLASAITVYGQETTVIKRKLTGGVTERITVLKTDKNVKEGFYQAFIQGTTNALAVGRYTNNQKTGVWSFFGTKNNLLQRYNYTTRLLTYEAQEDSASNCRYVVDDSLKQTSVTTKPVRIGDRYYGYINYLKIFKLPKDLQDIDPRLVNTVIELLVSPGGRLADYTFHIQNSAFQQKFSFNLDLLSEEDKTFIPATIDGKPVACRIFINCYLTNDGKIDIE